MTQITEDLPTFFELYATHPHYRAPRGTTLHAGSWQTEAPLRMLLNNLDSEVAEDPENLIVYGGTGQAARNRQALEEIIKHLLSLKDNQSLLIQSGKAAGVIQTHPEAPRVLIANSNLVPHWANWDHFEKLKANGLIMYGQMTAGSWIYIGTQGILQGTYETFAEMASRRFNNSLKGKWIVSGGLGGMGGAQPLAATLNGACFLGVDIDPGRIEKRLATGYLDVAAKNLDDALEKLMHAKNQGKALSVGLQADISTTLQKLLEKGTIPDAATDQTSAHDPLNGYIPSGYTVESAEKLRKTDPEAYIHLSKTSMCRHVNALLEMQAKGVVVFDYGNNLREFAKEGGAERAFDIPGFVPEYIRPLFCEGKGPFRWAALSGNPEDIYKTDQALMELFPENQHLHRWLSAAKKHVHFQGLPARICWLGLGERDRAGILFNNMVKSKEISAPIVIGRDHLDSGSVASPNRETEGMLDGSDAVSDWPLLNLMTNTASGATWVSFHHGGGVGMGFAQHAGMVIVADGTKRAEERLKRVLFNDPATGVIRHADAGYQTAQALYKEFHLG